VSTNRLIAPALLTSGHDVGQFCSGESELDDWLKRRALKNQDTGASRTYAITNGTRVVGYYCLAAGGVAQVQVPGRVRRNMPDPIPVMIIGRLAVDQMFQGQGLGRALLRDALLRTLQAADIAGIRAVLLHALTEQARLFYVHYRFYPSTVDPMTLMITLTEIRALLCSTEHAQN
jgi:GNAT superfamily N-acetyltransferase